MGWLANVLPHTTITSSWGNYIRSHVIHAYSSGGDRDTQTTGVRQAGMVAYTSSDNKLSYVGPDGNTWYPLTESLPFIPDWRAGYNNTATASGTIYFSSAMAVPPIVTVTLNTYYGGSPADLLTISGTFVDRFTFITQRTPVNFYWMAVSPR